MEKWSYRPQIHHGVALAPLLGSSSGQRRPATSSWPTFNEAISISSARSLRITAFAITTRPRASAPSADTPTATGPTAVGPSSRAPTALNPVNAAPVNDAGVVSGPFDLRAMLRPPVIGGLVVYTRRT